LITDGVLIDNTYTLEESPGPIILKWFKYLLASNSIDYSKKKFLEELKDTNFTLAKYVGGMVDEALVPQLGGDKYLVPFLMHYVGTPNKNTIVVVADNNQELIFLLKVCEVCLKANPNLTIKFVAKKDNKCLNDASIFDARKALSDDSFDTDIYNELRKYGQKGRFILVEGPPSHGLPLERISQELAQAIKDADAVVCIGEANLSSAKALAAKKPVYFGLKLKWKPFVEMVCGIPPLEGDSNPPAFFRFGEKRLATDIKHPQADISLSAV
jgi:hypothetical protein